MLTVRPQSKVCLTLCNFRFERLGCTRPYKNDLIAWLTKPKVLYAQLRKGCFACKSKICSQPSSRVPVLPQIRPSLQTEGEDLWAQLRFGLPNLGVQI